MDGIGRNRISIELCLVEYRVGLRRGLEFFGIVTEVQDSARSGLKPDFLCIFQPEEPLPQAVLMALSSM
jgi:hypothetical protein